MEEKHKSRLIGEFRQELDNKRLHVLEIPDEYKFMDEELVELIWTGTEALVQRLIEEPRSL